MCRPDDFIHEDEPTINESVLCTGDILCQYHQHDDLDNIEEDMLEGLEKR